MRPGSISEALQRDLSANGKWIVNPCPNALVLQECLEAVSLLDLDWIEMPNRFDVAWGSRLDHMIRQKLVVELCDGPPSLVPGVKMPKLYTEDGGLERVQTPVESDLDVMVLPLLPVVAKNAKPVTDLTTPRDDHAPVAVGA
jgi:hypothetical protein